MTLTVARAMPRAHTPRSSRPSRGPHVAVIAEAKGRPLLPWQRDAVDVALEVDPATGLYWYGIVVVRVQRQAGKTKLVGDVADHRCLSKPRARVWFTQQTGNDAATWMREEHFAALEDAAGLFGDPSSSSCRYSISRRAASVGIVWKQSRSTFYAFAPKKDAMHSKQSDLTIVDEAWAHDAAKSKELRQAIRPTMATRPGAQLWIVSAAGDDGSEMLAEYVAMGKLSLTDPNTRICFIDYGIPDDADPMDLETILAWHPAYGFTQNRESFEIAFDEFRHDPDGWARAYGTRDTQARTSVWPAHVWADCGTGRVDVPAAAGVAFDTTPRGDEGALAVAWRGPDPVTRAELSYVEVLEAGGIGRDFPDRVAQVARAKAPSSEHAGVVDFDPRSVASLEVVDALARHHPDVKARAVTGPQFAQACGTYSREVFARSLRHFHQSDLTAATEAATATPYGDGGFGWARKTSSGSIAALVATTVALRAFDTRPAPLVKARAAGRRR